MSMKSKTSSKHVLLLPFMAQGHLKPFLQLAHLIRRRSRGLTITILTTPLNVQLLERMSGNPEFMEPGQTGSPPSVVRLVALPFRCSEYGLPDEAENADMKPLAVIMKLLGASTALEAPVRRFVDEEIVRKEGRPPLSIISDVFLGWGVELAYSFASLPLTFSTAGAYGSAVYLSTWGDLPRQSFAKEEGVAFPETRRFLMSLDTAGSYTNEWSEFIHSQLSKSMKSAGWLFNKFEELEPLGLSVLRSHIKHPVWAVASLGANETQPDEKKNTVLTWLDLQPQGSVVYICLGSQVALTHPQMMELATGLEESGKRFVWVIRPPLGFDIEGEFKSEWLPNGFQETVIGTEKRGLLVHKWGPQWEILSHKSTGAFLSHCGWNSVLESLSRGVPMIGWPFRTEQVCSVKMLEEMGVAVELLEGSVTKEDVKRAVNVVLDTQGKGGEMKRKANEVGRIIQLATAEDGDHTGCSLKAIDGLLHTLFQQAN
uniref:Glycosyltransferase n=1 Tax=Rheum officinale TaxID=137220 RepID=A0A7L9A2I2_RHEOF|nr:UDP-glycosyltransferase 92A1 [Rheum officinale]